MKRTTEDEGGGKRGKKGGVLSITTWKLQVRYRKYLKKGGGEKKKEEGKEKKLHQMALGI